MGRTLNNPIIPGFYPDPSVCRKNDEYYLITSTFEYFPGIPIFCSKDFVHWKQIGHVLSKPEQLNLDGIKPSKGIYASSIFYHEERDRFYVITTLVGNSPYWENVNFYVWADKPEGPWSSPIVVKGAEGIDPSLVFDRGKAYYLGNRRPYPEQPERGRHIWLQELDLDTGELLGERYTLLEHGAFPIAAAPEGPHIYHIHDWYYLLIAEGGTFRNHSSTIFRSREIRGPYEPSPRNPLITHRNLKRDYPIQYPGHGDMIQLHNGEWWAVLLAVRSEGGNLGRETFAVPVSWEEDWPLFSPETGRVEFTYPAPDLPEHVWNVKSDKDSFDDINLSYEWITIRTPRHKLYSLSDRKGYLRLFLNEKTIKEQDCCSFLGRRQQHMSYTVNTLMEFEPKKDGETAGILLLMNQNYHIRMEYGWFGNKREIRLTKCFAGADEKIAQAEAETMRIWIRVVVNYKDISFYVSWDGKNWLTIAEHVDGSLLGREVAGGYTGAMVGMYASSNGQESSNYADFDWFEYKGWS